MHEHTLEVYIVRVSAEELLRREMRLRVGWQMWWIVYFFFGLTVYILISVL